MTDPERLTVAHHRTRQLAAHNPDVALVLADYDAMSLRYQRADVENARMRAELTARSAA